MGILYNSMIKEVILELPKNKKDIELFLKNKEHDYKELYKLPESLFYLNISEVLDISGVHSDYFKTKKDESNENCF